MVNYSTANWIVKATHLLSKLDIPTARLDTLILLEDITKKDRGWLLAHPEFVLSHDQLALLEDQLERRASHEPLAYIRGKSEFYGREFKVTPTTLQPRPETETLVEEFKKLSLPSQPVVADIGTGSGAIIVTLKLLHTDMVACATEIQPDALAVAQANASKYGAEIQFHLGNLLEPLHNQNVDVVAANLPYVPDGHTINQAAMQEPKVAIFGGADGLDLYRQLFNQITTRSQKPTYILTESLPFQHEALADIAKKSGYNQTDQADFIQVFQQA